MTSAWLNGILSLWPLFTGAAALVFFRKQNSKDAWTGGPISIPKALWLTFTVFTWFLAPFFFLAHPDFPDAIRSAFYFHLGSWWIRGILELFMIFRWKNWNPFYGVTHDLFHIAGFTALLGGWPSGLTPFGEITYGFAALILYSTVFEAIFAWKFKMIRSADEEAEHVYYASDEEKWRQVNRLTATAVFLCYSHLLIQSALLLTR